MKFRLPDWVQILLGLALLVLAVLRIVVNREPFELGRAATMILALWLCWRGYQKTSGRS